MAVHEHDRHRFHNRAVEVFGEEEADILMAHLPPGGWSNLATKQDLLEVEARLKAHTFRTILAANLSMAAVFASLAFAVAGLG